MFVVRKTMSMGQLLSFLLTATNFYSPQIRKNCIGNNAISVVQDYEQDTRKTTNDGESRGRIARHYRFCKFDDESITNPHPIGLLAHYWDTCGSPVIKCLCFFVVFLLGYLW